MGQVNIRDVYYIFFFIEHSIFIDPRTEMGRSRRRALHPASRTHKHFLWLRPREHPGINLIDEFKEPILSAYAFPDDCVYINIESTFYRI
jgi:hypothetical protein